MRLKREYKNILFDLLENSNFEINEFDIDNPDGNEYITLNYIYNNNTLSFKFERINKLEFLVSYNTPIEPDIKGFRILFNRNSDINEQKIKIPLHKQLTRWLKQINEEIKTPDKFTQYFNNLKKLKFNDISESKGKQPPNIAESKILIQQLDDIKKTILNTKDILLDGQEILFEDLQEIREDIKKKQSSLRGIINKIIGAIFKWGLYFAIPSDVVKNLFEQFMDGIMKMLGE